AGISRIDDRYNPAVVSTEIGPVGFGFNAVQLAGFRIYDQQSQIAFSRSGRDDRVSLVRKISQHHVDHFALLLRVAGLLSLTIDFRQRRGQLYRPSVSQQLDSLSL